MRAPRGAPPSTSSDLPEPLVLPPGTPSTSGSGDMTPSRLAPYRLDATAPHRFPDETLFFSNTALPPPSHESDCPTSPASGGDPASTLPPRIGTRRSDCRRALTPQNNLEPYKRTNRGRCRPGTMPYTRNGDQAYIRPRGVFRTMAVVATCHRGVRHESRRAEPRQRFHRRDAPSMHHREAPEPDAAPPGPNEPFELAETELRDTWWPRKTATARRSTIADRTNRSPTVHRP